MTISSSQYYAPGYYPQQNIAPVTAPEKKESSIVDTFIKGAAVVAGTGIVAMAGLKTHSVNKALKETGLQSESKISLAKTFFRNLNFLNWESDADKAKSLIAKNYTQIGNEGRIYRNSQGDSFILLDGNKTFDVKTGKNVTDIKYQEKAPIQLRKEEVGSLIDSTKITLPEKLKTAWSEVVPQMQNRDTETMFIHNMETGEKITEASNHSELQTSFSQEEQATIQKAIDNKQKLAMIHNHTADATFSAQDLASIANPDSNYDVMGVVTKGGGFGIFKKVENTSAFDDARFQKNVTVLQAYTNMELGLTVKLQAQGESDAKICEKLDHLRKTNLPKVAKQLGYEYSYVPPKVASKDTVKFPDYSEVIKQAAQQAGIPESTYKDYLVNIDHLNPNTLDNLVAQEEAARKQVLDTVA